MQLDIYISAVSTGRTHKYIAVPSHMEMSIIKFSESLDSDLNTVSLYMPSQEFHHGQVRAGLSSAAITDVLDQIEAKGYATYSVEVDTIVLRR